jgi:hypothetical protein
MVSLLNEPALSIRVREHEEPGIEVRVNFGPFAGRHVTPAEIDELAATLRESVELFAIVAEDRHEFGGDVEATVHQLVVEVAQNAAAADPDHLAEEILVIANDWAIDCIESRQGGGEL